VDAMRCKLAYPRPRGGFTLLELLLVVAVLVGVGAIGYASMLGFGESQRMTRVSDDLRGLVTGLRIQAMEEQRPYILAYRPETAEYLIRTDSAESVERESTTPVRGPMRGDVGYLLGPHLLEEELRFMTIDKPIDPSAPSSQIDLAQDGWIVHLFEPDGTCEDFSVGIVDRDGYAVIARVAGRTGRVLMQGPFALANASIPAGAVR
jgi:prepilin-type N-terminal cleavage/methylation domain-containing protein